MNFGMWELLIIMIIVALVFGTARLRNIGSDLGNALRSFRGALNDDDDEHMALHTMDKDGRETKDK